MKLVRPQPSHKGKITLYALGGVVLLALGYLVLNFDTSAPQQEIRKEINLDELR